jgi:hypothetical protein
MTFVLYGVFYNSICKDRKQYCLHGLARPELFAVQIYKKKKLCLFMNNRKALFFFYLTENCVSMLSKCKVERSTNVVVNTFASFRSFSPTECRTSHLKNNATKVNV